MKPLWLIAASDDFLLEEALKETVAGLETCLGVSAEPLDAGVTPEQVALEVTSPTLFAAERLLVVEDVRPWLDTTTPVDAPKTTEDVDLEPLLQTLAEGVPSGMALVLGAWCGSKPKGKLVDLCSRHGEVRWVASPAPPKPWDTVTLSAEQLEVLGKLLRRAAGPVVFTRAAAQLLMERLGFAPRQLAREVEKLAAANAGGEVDEALVRALTFPAERSLEAVRRAVLAADVRPVLDLLASAAAGKPIRDVHGKRLDSDKLATTLFRQVASLLAQMLDVRAATRRLGVEAELDPRRTSAFGWYPRTFKDGLGPRLVETLDPDSPLRKRDGSVNVFSLGQVFAGAARYREDHLRRCLAAAGETEVRLRIQADEFVVLTAWVATLEPGDRARQPA